MCRRTLCSENLSAAVVSTSEKKYFRDILCRKSKNNTGSSSFTDELPVFFTDIFF